LEAELQQNAEAHIFFGEERRFTGTKEKSAHDFQDPQ
jgi:hypothetical protein